MPQNRVDVGSPKISFNALSLLKYLPGCIACMDLENRFNYYINDECAYVNGYDSVDEMYGNKIEEVRCKAAEAAPMWIEQNQTVLKSNRLLKLLDIHPYRDNEIKILLSQKTPLFDDKQYPIATLFHGVEINQTNLTKVFLHIAKLDKRFQIKNNINHRSYYIGNSLKDSNLTNREIECLFYVVRGKTANQIAKILFISKRTVETHIANIKSKLGCVNKSDLIDKAVTDNLINLLPESIFNNLQSGISIII